MAFDPDQYLKENDPTSIKSKTDTAAPQAPAASFDPDAYLTNSFDSLVKSKHYDPHQAAADALTQDPNSGEFTVDYQSPSFKQAMAVDAERKRLKLDPTDPGFIEKAKNAATAAGHWLSGLLGGALYHPALGLKDAAVAQVTGDDKAGEAAAYHLGQTVRAGQMAGTTMKGIASGFDEGDRAEARVREDDALKRSVMLKSGEIDQAAAEKLYADERAKLQAKWDAEDFGLKVINARKQSILSGGKPLDSGAIGQATASLVGTGPSQFGQSPTEAAARGVTTTPKTDEFMTQAGAMTLAPENLAFEFAPGVPGIGPGMRLAGRAMEWGGEALPSLLKKYPKAAGLAGATTLGAGAMAAAQHLPEIMAHKKEAAAVGGLALLLAGTAAGMRPAGRLVRSAGEMASGIPLAESVGPIGVRARKSLAGAVGGGVFGTGLETLKDDPDYVQGGLTGLAIGAAAGGLSSPKPVLEYNAAAAMAQRGNDIRSGHAMEPMHREILGQFDQGTQDQLNRLRAHFYDGSGTDVLLVDRNGMRKAQESGDIQASAEGIFNPSDPYAQSKDGQTIYLNVDTIADNAGLKSTAGHEAGHAVVNYLTSSARASDAMGLFNTIRDSLGSQNYETFANSYREALKRGAGASDAHIGDLQDAMRAKADEVGNGLEKSLGRPPSADEITDALFNDPQARALQEQLNLTKQDAGAIDNLGQQTKESEARRAAIPGELEKSLGRKPTAEEVAQAMLADPEVGPSHYIDNEAVAEITAKILNGQDIASFALPKGVKERVLDAASQWLEDQGWKPAASKSEDLGYRGRDVAEANRKIRDVLYEQGEKAKGVRKRATDVASGRVEPTVPERLGQIGAEIEQLDAIDPSAITPTQLKQRNDLVREAAQLSQREQQRQGVQPAAPEPQAAAPAPAPAAPPVAPAVDTTAQMRTDVESGLRGLGLPQATAKDLAARAQGASVEEMLRSALGLHASRRTTAPAPATAPVPATPPAPAPAPTGLGAVELTGEAPATEAQAIPATGVATLELNEPPATPQTTAPGESGASQPPAPGATPATPGRTPPSVPTPEAVRSALDAATTAAQASVEHGRAKSDNGRAKIVSAARQKALVDQLPSFDARAAKIGEKAPDELHRHTDAFGEESLRGDLDDTNPLHSAIMDEAGLSTTARENLATLQASKGTPLFVDYTAAKVEEGAEHSAAQRGKELAESTPADRLDGGDATEQKNKAVIPYGTAVTSKGNVLVRVFSPDKMHANALAVVRKANDQGMAHGYEGSEKKIAEALSNDIETYTANHANGWSGDGSTWLRGGKPQGEGIPLKGADGKPVDATTAKQRLDVLNMAANDTGASASAELRAKQGDYQARKQAWEDGGKQGRAPREPKPLSDLKLTQEQESQGMTREKGDYQNPQTGEPNKLRDAMATEGFGPKDLESTVESLHPELIRAVRNEPDGGRSIVRAEGTPPGQAPSFPYVRAGFKPAEGTSIKSKTLGDLNLKPDETDPVTGRKTLIPRGKLTPEESQAAAAALSATTRRYDEALRRAAEDDSVEASQQLADATPQAELEEVGLKFVPDVGIATTGDSNLKLLGRGGESVAFGDGSVAYKFFYPQESDSGRTGVGITGEFTQKPDGSWSMDYVPGSVRDTIDKLRVISTIGGIPSEVLGVTSGGGLLVKQPRYPLAPIEGHRGKAFIGAHDKMQAEIPAKEARDAGLPFDVQRVAVVDGVPYALSDLGGNNYTADNTGNFRLADAVLAPMPKEFLESFPALREQVERMTREERTNRASVSFKPVAEKINGDLDEIAKRGGQNLDAYAYATDAGGNTIIKLENLQALKDAPAGTGTAYMKDLVKYADDNGLTIALQTADKGDLGAGGKYKKTSSSRRLKDFYGRFGFKSNYGKRSYRADLPGNMHREPAGGSKQFFYKPSDTPAFKKWAGEDTPVVEAGDPLPKVNADGPIVVEGFHGTTHDFNTIDTSKANMENDFGRGFYMTSNAEDVASNYAGVGPDLTNRIERRAERLEQELDGMDTEDMMDTFDLTEEEANFLKENEGYSYSSPQAERKNEIINRLASKELTTHGGATMKLYAKLNKPLYLGGENDTYWHSDYNEESGDAEGPMVDFVEALRNAASRYDDADLGDSQLDFMLMDGAKASDAIKEARMALGNAMDPETGDMAGSEIIREALENMGYDGIVDSTVDEKFGSQRKLGKQMKGMDEDTFHVITFDNASIKSAIGNKTFDAKNPDIRFSPGEGRDKIQAALRLHDGTIINAPSHGFAYDEANRQGKNLAGVEEGFTINDEFMHRDEAYRRRGGSTMEDFKPKRKVDYGISDDELVRQLSMKPESDRSQVDNPDSPHYRPRDSDGKFLSPLTDRRKHRKSGDHEQTSLSTLGFEAPTPQRGRSLGDLQLATQ